MYCFYQSFYKDNTFLINYQKKILQFVGFIFFGVLVENNECYLLEYNMRLGDPETQVIMALLESNLLDVLTDCLEGKEINLSYCGAKIKMFCNENIPIDTALHCIEQH